MAPSPVPDGKEVGQPVVALAPEPVAIPHPVDTPWVDSPPFMLGRPMRGTAGLPGLGSGLGLGVRVKVKVKVKVRVKVKVTVKVRVKGYRSVSSCLC